MLRAYIDKRFNRSSVALIEKATAICTDYRRQGFDLTLRQLYYQFVARGYLPNADSEYKRLGNVVNDARLAGCWTGTSSSTAPATCVVPPTGTGRAR